MTNQAKETILGELPKAITDVEELAKDRRAGMINNDEFIEKAEEAGNAIVNTIVRPQMEEYYDKKEQKEDEEYAEKAEFDKVMDYQDQHMRFLHAQFGLGR